MKTKMHRPLSGFRLPLSAALFALLCCAPPSRAQTVLFDFENATQYSPLPINLTVSGITASLTATGQGFSIQQSSVLGFTPAGFSGLCVYPSSVFAADLQVGFSQTLTNFSILYAPEEYACDSSATMRVTAYMNGTYVGTATTNAVAGTWPSETLAFSSTQGFNSVVVHYDKAPATGGDYGPVFMADNMNVSLAPQLPALQILSLGQEVQITWPTNFTGFVLQENGDVGTANWLNSSNPVTIAGTNYQSTFSITNTARYFRLTHP